MATSPSQMVQVQKKLGLLKWRKSLALPICCGRHRAATSHRRFGPALTRTSVGRPAGAHACGGSSQFIYKRHFLKLIKLTPGWAERALLSQHTSNPNASPLGTLAPPLPYTGLPLFLFLFFTFEKWAFFSSSPSQSSPVSPAFRHPLLPTPPTASSLALAHTQLAAEDSPWAIPNNWDSNRSEHGEQHQHWIFL